MELDLPALRFLVALGEAMESTDLTWPDEIGINISLRTHGSTFATWRSEGGATIWRLGESE